MTVNARHLRHGRHLRRGMTLRAATDILWTYSSPDLYELLVGQRRWSSVALRPVHRRCDDCRAADAGNAFAGAPAGLNYATVMCGRTMSADDSTKLSPLAGKPAPREILIDPARLEREYYERTPDLADPGQLVAFGTSGHRGTPSNGTFTEAHILAITQAICEYRAGARHRRPAVPRQGHACASRRLRSGRRSRCSRRTASTPSSSRTTGSRRRR